MLIRWFLVGAAALTGCSSVKPTAKVHLAHEEDRGKALFLVSPATPNPECTVPVQTPTGAKPLDCNSQYLVACDIDTPLDQPFCELVREVGTDRMSAYPKLRRQ